MFWENPGDADVRAMFRMIEPDSNKKSGWALDAATDQVSYAHFGNGRFPSNVTWYTPHGMAVCPCCYQLSGDLRQWQIILILIPTFNRLVNCKDSERCICRQLWADVAGDNTTQHSHIYIVCYQQKKSFVSANLHNYENCFLLEVINSSDLITVIYPI
jgi:hypothetical protein